MSDHFGSSIPTLEERRSEIVRALEAEPWIDRILRVDLSPTGGKIDVAYRRPVLYIPLIERGCYVDGRGVALPAREATDESLRSCLSLDGYSTAAAPRTGEPFPDGRIARLAKLAKELAPFRDRFRLAQIVVHGEQTQLRLFDGGLVKWTLGGSTATQLRNFAWWHDLVGGEGPFLYDARSTPPPRPERLGR